MRPGIGHSLMPSFSTISRCTPTNAISIPGITKTCSAKKRDSVAPAMIGPPSIRFTNHGPMNGLRLADRSPDPKSPISVLIEAQHLPGERHAQRHQEQEYADDPGQFAGKLVGPEQKHLHHVNEDNGDHEIRAPSVQRANEPAQRNVVIQNLQAVPRLARGGHVDEREQNAGDDLQDEDGQAALPNT